MTRNLRKRHLLLWLVVTFFTLILLILARVNTPKFEGDQVKTEQGEK